MSNALKNEIHAYFGVQNSTTTAKVSQWASGQKLVIHDEELPSVFEAYYSNSRHRGDAKPQIGSNGVVDAPYEFFKSGKDIFVFLMVHETEDDSRYEKVVHIPIDPCPKPTGEEPEPHQQGVIDQTIAALNNGVASATASAAAAAQSEENGNASALKSEGYAVGTQNGVTVDSESPYHNNNAKYYAEEAENAKQSIEALTVSASALIEGAAPYASKYMRNGHVHISFGIPRGNRGQGGLSLRASNPVCVIHLDKDGKLDRELNWASTVSLFYGSTQFDVHGPMTAIGGWVFFWDDETK